MTNRHEKIFKKNHFLKKAVKSGLAYNANLKI